MSIIRDVSRHNYQKLVWVLLALCLSGCALTFETVNTPAPVTPGSLIPIETAETVATEAVESPTAIPEDFYQPMSLPEGLRDELPLMQGICYEAAQSFAGQVFIMRNAIDHIRFYAQADEAQLCRHPVTRYPFDFETGRVLVGFWQIGRGCTARHEVTGVERDEAQKTITLRVSFFTEGECGYELIRPFWVSIPDATDWEIEFVQG